MLKYNIPSIKDRPEWIILAIKNGRYFILVPLIWEDTCKWTDIPPNDKIIEVKIIFTFKGIAKMLSSFKPIVISKIDLTKQDI